MLAPQRLSAFLPLPYSINSVQRLLKSKETHPIPNMSNIYYGAILLDV